MWAQMIHRHNGICFCFTVLHIKWSHQDTTDCALWPKTNPQSFTFCHPVLYSSQHVSIDKRESEEPTGRALLTKGRHTYITKWQDAVFARLAFFCISGVCIAIASTFPCFRMHWGEGCGVYCWVARSKKKEHTVEKTGSWQKTWMRIN